jgi:hypothetical protein
MGRKKDLFKEMRSRGVRKSVAREVSSALAGSDGRKPEAVRRAAEDLASAVALIQSEMGDAKPRRRLAAKPKRTLKPARTRKQTARTRKPTAKGRSTRVL